MEKIRLLLRELFIGTGKNHPSWLLFRRISLSTPRHKMQGFTVVEIFLSAIIFTFLLLILLNIPISSIKHRQIARNQTSILDSIRRAELELTKAVSNSTWRQFNESNIEGIYYFKGDTGHSGEHAILLQSAESIGSEEITADENGIPVATKYILYYIIRPSGDSCPAPASIDSDNFCPHKLLVRKDLRLDTFSLIDDYTSIKNKIYTDYINHTLSVAGNVVYTKTVAQWVLSFDVSISSNPAGAHTVMFNGASCSVDEACLGIILRGFREKEFQKKTAGQTIDLTLDPLMTFSTDDKITPQN